MELPRKCAILGNMKTQTNLKTSTLWFICSLAALALLGLVGPGNAQAHPERASAADQTDDSMIPLIDMGSATYLGFSGGLYPNRSNQLPADHDLAGKAFAQGIRPLNTAGKPDPAGKYVLLSIGMSNTTQEYCYPLPGRNYECNAWTFGGQAAADPAVNHTSLKIIDGAAGGQTAYLWLSPQDANYDRVRDEALAPQGLSEKQVQIVWIKQADGNPGLLYPSLPEAGADAFILEEELGQIVRAVKVRYPNVKQVFFSSRIYGGYALKTLNPEPFAYESGFSVKWLIEAQINQMRSGQIDPLAGDLDYNGAAPWLAWAAYLWADGANPRSDGLVWLPEDMDDDGTHPSTSGEQKVGSLLLAFFKSSPQTRCWFLAGQSCQAGGYFLPLIIR
jgi:hypothetical protein